MTYIVRNKEGRLIAELSDRAAIESIGDDHVDCKTVDKQNRLVINKPLCLSVKDYNGNPTIKLYLLEGYYIHKEH